MDGLVNLVTVERIARERGVEASSLGYKPRQEAAAHAR
jgi:hypothetical protein